MARKKSRKKTAVRFPKKELNTWLRKHLNWDQKEWENLIESLGTQGFGEWVSTQEGKNKIGFYLETKRKAVAS